MRRVALTTAAFILAVAGTSFAQRFIQYTSRADFFAVSFPGEPNIQETPWMSEQGITLPAHVYSSGTAFTSTPTRCARRSGAGARRS